MDALDVWFCRYSWNECQDRREIDMAGKHEIDLCSGLGVDGQRDIGTLVLAYDPAAALDPDDTAIWIDREATFSKPSSAGREGCAFLAHRSEHVT